MAFLLLYCTHVRMLYVLNLYLLTYVLKHRRTSMQIGFLFIQRDFWKRWRQTACVHFGMRVLLQCLLECVADTADLGITQTRSSRTKAENAVLLGALKFATFDK